MENDTMRVTAEKKAARRRSLSLLLALSMVLSLFCAVPAAAAPETAVSERSYAAPNDQVLSSVERLAELDILRGDPDGGLYPDRVLKRSEFAAMVNRAYGFTQSGPTPFTDVPETAWYANDIGIAYNAGYFKGTLPNTASPEAQLTRQDTVLLLARNMRLDEVPGQIIELSDGDSVSHYAMGHVRAMAQAGLIDDNGGNGFRPRDPITRGEMAQLLLNCVGTPVRDGGAQSLGNVAGNVTISAPGAVLRDTTIAGDLYISGGIGSKGVTLENVNVLGRVVVAGGGEAEGGTDSVILRNVEAEELLVDNISGEYLSLRAEGDTSVSDALFKSGAFILDRTPDGYGLLNIGLDSASPASFTLSGNIKDATNFTPGSTLNVAQATVKDLIIDQDAAGSTLNVSNDATVRKLSLDTGVPVTGTGDIDDLQVNTLGSTVESLPDRVTVRPGLTANVAGAEMDAKAAAESSADPRLLAGYPKMKNVAPTSATAVFSANKAGTVYWAVSAAADGSIGESELIEPLAYGSKALKQGNLKATASNTEVSANISGLTKGGTYYLSAVMVDARGTRSPVKVVSFGTPDDTVPAFTTAPKVIRVGKDIGRVQISATTNKSCVLHYALMPRDAAALTANDFKTSALTGNYGHGTVNMTRNVTEYINVNSRTLAEQTEYALYLWLVDADGVKSSGITRVSVRTGDETPPVFLQEFESPVAKSNAISGTVVVNEAATVFWVAVEAGTPYPTRTGVPGTLPLDSLNAKVVVENGSGKIVSSGSVRATANKSATLNINRLQPESSYDLYYVAKDAGGNYSQVVKVTTDLHTLDGTAPTAHLEFSHSKKQGDNVSPYADSDIDIVFSENVQQFSSGQALLDLYSQTLANPDLKPTFAAVLAECIRFYSGGSTTPLPGRVPGSTDPGWAIDYHNAQVLRDQKTGEVIVRFPNGGNTSTSALNLSSNATYRFVLDDISDTSDGANTMDETVLGPFRTISSQVELRTLDHFFNHKEISYPQDNPIDSDAGFSLKPVSTSTASPTQSYDILIWSDRTVTFDLYTRTNMGTDASPNYTPWAKVGNKSVTLDTTAGTFAFRSVGLHFNEPTSFQRVIDLNEDYTYEYGINVLAVDGNNDRSTWGETVTFRYSVVAGPEGKLITLASAMDQAGFDQNVGEGKDLEEAGVSEKYPCEQDAPFVGKRPLAFTGSYPTIAAGSNSVNISFALDSTAAAVYWAVSPVDVTVNGADPIHRADAETDPSTLISSPARTIAADPGLNAPNGEVRLSEVPSAGSTAINATRRPLFQLSNPTYSSVMNNQLGQGTIWGVMSNVGGNGRVSITDPRLSQLEHNQWYFVYFLLVGSGGINSEVYVYKFCTKEVARPVIEASWSTAESAQVISHSPGSLTVDYILVSGNSLETLGNDLLNESFRDHAIPEFSTDDATAQYRNRSFTVLDAIAAKMRGGANDFIGSVFDNYATTAAKDLAYSALHPSAIDTGATGNGVRGQKTVNIAANRSISVNFSSVADGFGPNAMVNGPKYYFFAVGYNRENLSAGYSFGSASTFEKVSQDAPVVREAWCDFIPVDETDPTKGHKMKVGVSFGEILYANTSSGTKKVTLRGIMDRPAPADDYISAHSLVSATACTDNFVLLEAPSDPRYDTTESLSFSYDPRVTQRVYRFSFTQQFCNVGGQTPKEGNFTFSIAVDVKGNDTDGWHYTITVSPTEAGANEKWEG